MKTKEIKLTDVCDFQGGTQPPKEEWINEPRKGYVRMLQIRDFTQNKAQHVAYVKDTKKLNKCSSDDILIGRYGASVGKILTGHEGAYNVAIIKTIPDESKLLKKYLYYVLTGKSFQNFINNIGARAAQAGFNKNDLTHFKLNLPSLENQERIASILNKAELLVRQRKETIALLNVFLQSCYLKMFDNPITNKFRFPSGKISDVVTEVKYGTSKPSEEEGKYPYLRMNNISYEGYWDYSSMKYINVRDNEKEKYLVRKGDLIFNRTNSKELVGKSAVFNRDDEMIIAGYLIRIRVNEKANPWYLWGYLNSNFGKKTLFELCRNIVGMANINAQELQSINISIPPLELQNKFAKIVEKVGEIKSEFEDSLIELETLFESLGQMAYKGELNFVENHVIKGNIKIKPNVKGEIIVIDEINKNLENFHKSLPHSGAPAKIDNKLRQLDTELKIRGEVEYDEDYLKYRIIKDKFKDPFTFEQLWEEVIKFPFETVPKYDEITALLFNWLKDEKPFIKQKFNENTKQIELMLK